MEAAASRIDVGRVIGESFELYKRNAGVLIATAAVVFVVAGILQGLLQEGAGFVGALLGAVVNLIATALFTGFVVRVVEDVRADGRRDLRVGDLVGSTKHAIAPLIGNSILRAIGIVIGLALLIVPGLYLLTIWAVCSPAIVAERQGALDAFGRSQELVRGHGWTVFGCIIVAFLIVIGLGIVLTAVGVGIAGAGGAVVGAIIASLLSAPIAALVSSILFFDLGGGSAASPAAPSAPAPVA